MMQAVRADAIMCGSASAEIADGNLNTYGRAGSAQGQTCVDSGEIHPRGMIAELRQMPKTPSNEVRGKWCTVSW